MTTPQIKRLLNAPVIQRLQPGEGITFTGRHQRETTLQKREAGLHVHSQSASGTMDFIITDQGIRDISISKGKLRFQGSENLAKALLSHIYHEVSRCTPFHQSTLGKRKKPKA